MIQITEERPDDAAAIEKLLNSAFGPKRKRKISYRYRLRLAPVPGLSFVAVEDGVVAGTIRHWPILICAADGSQSSALLLGPLAVSSSHRGEGLGAQLMNRGLESARAAGQNLVILVGDLPYYARFGFVRASQFGIQMPYEKPERVLVLPLNPGIPVPEGMTRHAEAATAKITAGQTAA